MKRSKEKDRNNTLNFIIVNKKLYPELEQAYKILLTQNATVECIEVVEDVENIKKSSIYIMGNFGGKIFDQIKKSAKIIGGHCIIKAFHDNLSIPKSLSPVFSLTLQRKVVTSTGLGPRERMHIKDRVSWMGGLFVNALTDSVTHLISSSVGSKKYKIARQLKLEINLPTWIDHLWRTQSFESAENFHCPSLKGLVVSLSGFSASDRSSLKSIIERNGGEYSVNVRVSHCTHLVVTVTPVISEKVKTAKKNNIYIVAPSWLYESDKSPYCADEVDHHVEVDSFEDPVLLFAEETQDIPSFSEETHEILEATHVDDTSDDYKMLELTSSAESQVESLGNITNSQCSTIKHNDIISHYEIPSRIFDGLSFRMHSTIGESIQRQITNNGGIISADCDYVVCPIVVCDVDCEEMVTDVWIVCSVLAERLLERSNRFFRPVILRNEHLLDSLAFRFEVAEDGLISGKIMLESLVTIVERHGGLYVSGEISEFEGKRKSLLVCKSAERRSSELPVVSYDWVFDIVDKGTFDPVLDLPLPGSEIGGLSTSVDTAPKFRLSDAFEMCLTDSFSNVSSLNLSKRFPLALSEAVRNMEGGILRGVVCHFHPPDEDLKETVLSLGGENSDSMISKVTHLVVSQNYRKKVCPTVKVVSPDWLLQCKSENKRLSETPFEVSQGEPLMDKFVSLLGERTPPSVSSLVESVYRPVSRAMPSFEVKLRDELAERELQRLSGSFDSLLLDDSGFGVHSIVANEGQRSVFLFSSMTSREKEFCGGVLRGMGGIVIETTQYVEECTHLIAGSLSRNEKTLSCIAAGKWVLKMSFVYACHASSVLIDETPHQWTNSDSLPPSQQRLSSAILHWREQIQLRSIRPFYGWVCDVRISSEQKRGSFERLLLAGGGVLSFGSPPTHVFVEDASVDSDTNVLKTSYIETYLLDSSSSTKRYIKSYDNPTSKRLC